MARRSRVHIDSRHTSRAESMQPPREGDDSCGARPRTHPSQGAAFGCVTSDRCGRSAQDDLRFARTLINPSHHRHFTGTCSRRRKLMRRTPCSDCSAPTTIDLSSYFQAFLFEVAELLDRVVHVPDVEHPGISQLPKALDAKSRRTDEEFGVERFDHM